MLAKPVAESLLKKIKERTEKFTQGKNRPPHLSVVLVGNDPASQIYTKKKGEMAVSLGMSHETIQLPATSTAEEVRMRIEALNQNPNVDGILIQRPLPKSFHETDVLFWVNAEKDVDAFHPLHAGELVLGLPTFQPCTPAGIMHLLNYYKIQTHGKLACIIGRSSIVGKPIASLLLQNGATLLHCHSETLDIRKLSKQADILIVAAGKPGLVDRSFVKEGAAVIDVGVHRTPEGKTVGDVQFDDVASIVSAITPVPGGVGPMTIAVLMENTIRAAEFNLL